MSTHKHLDKICCAAVALALALTLVLMNASGLGIQAASRTLGYESRLFDDSIVHTIDIVMDDWEGFLAQCTDEEYVLCSVVIDGENCSNVAIRAKGNTSLTQVASYGNDRYSFKIEFDHYDSALTYHSLDKLSLNNIIQDNTYLKDYLTYQMMDWFGVDAPLCSFVYLTVNGEDWGLYLAVEGVEESFLERNYGGDYGELYKPDSTSMGGGRGNGGQFDLEDWLADSDDQTGSLPTAPFSDDQTESSQEQTMVPPDAVEGTFDPGSLPDSGTFDPESLGDGSFTPEDLPNSGTFDPGKPGGGMGGMMGSNDVSLIYTDDDYDSYSNIFDNAKTDLTDADRDRLIDALEQLNAGENIQDVVDVDEVIRYFVVHNFVCNFDSYTGSMIHNYYLYEEDGQLSMIPWDYNLAFGGFQSASDATALVNYPIDTPVSGGTVDSRPMLAWIFASEKYTQLYHQYFDQFISEYFESGHFAQVMDQVYALIAPYVEKDPTKFCTYEEFETGFATLEQFCLLRAESIRGQLEGTIPSTDEGQAQDSSTLIDASAITISDMGSMNNGGKDGFSPEDGMERPSRTQGDTVWQESSTPQEDAAAQESTVSPELPSVPSNSSQAERPQASTPAQSGTESGVQPGQSAGFDRQGSRMTGGWTDAAPSDGQDSGQWLLLAASGGVLLVGLLIAIFYKKRC